MKKTRKKRVEPAVDFTSFPMRLSVKKQAVVFDSPKLQTKSYSPPEGGRIALSANERIAEFLDFAIQAKFTYANKLSPSIFFGYGRSHQRFSWVTNAR